MRSQSGLIDRSPSDHSGGIVRNNFIYRAPGVGGDAAILVADSAGTQVLHNTALMSGGYPNAIEYRFAGATGVTIANNLLDGQIAARDGATGSVVGNMTTASAGMFVDPSSGNLHLKSTATAALNKIASPLAAAPDRLGWRHPARRGHRHRRRRIRRARAAALTAEPKGDYSVVGMRGVNG